LVNVRTFFEILEGSRLSCALLLVHLRPGVAAVLAPVGILEVFDVDCHRDVLLNLEWRHREAAIAVG